MTSATRADTPESPPAAPRRGLGTRILGVFRDPLRTFLVIAIPVGVYLALTVPYFGGIDEPAHFYRSYQISTGQFVPEKIKGSEFSGACVPLDLTKAVAGYQGAYFKHLVSLFPDAFANQPAVPAQQQPQCSSRDERPVTFSTFGSPIPYVPQTAAILAAREAGGDAGVMLLAGRFTLLAVYIAIVAIAIRRCRRGRWALAAVALVPVAVFQSASSLSPDAITNAVSLLVVSSALRALDADLDDTTPRSLIIEAALLSALLGMCKPAYVVVAGCYLLPLLGARERRARLWGLAPAAAVGVVVTFVWNEIVGDLWRTDATYFGIKPDPPARKHDLFTAPWHFVADSIRTVPDQLWEWLKGLWGVGISVTHWPGIVIVAAVLLFIAVSLQRERDEPAHLELLQVGLLALLFVIGMALVFAAIWIYWTTPGTDKITGLQARYFVPLLVLLPLMIGTPRVRWLTSRDARVPLALFLVPFFILFAATVTFRMH